MSEPNENNFPSLTEIERLWALAIAVNAKLHTEHNRCPEDAVAIIYTALKSVALKPEQGKCEWNGNNEQDYKTSCGKAYAWEDGGIKDNGFVHCPFCGKAIHETK